MNNSINNFPCGVITAAVTPFCNNGIDYKAFSELIKRQASNGAKAVVVLGTTGEAPTVTQEERDKITECAVEACGTMSVIVGCSSFDTKAAVSMCRRAESLGASGLLVSAPYYNRPSQQGLLRHFFTVADSVALPIMIYNVPSRTGITITPSQAEILFSHENIVALKEAGTDISDITEKLVRFGEKVYCGNDLLLPLFCSLGSGGAISVCTNLCYSRFCKIYELYKCGDCESARTEFASLYPFLLSLTCDTNPAPIKSVMHDFGLIEPDLRLPLTPVGEKKRSEILNAALIAGIKPE